MPQEYLDRLLAADEEVVPSSGFTGAVMEAVRRESSRPMPIPFPWKRASPGLVLAGLVLVALVFLPSPTNGFGGPELSLTKATEILVPMVATMRRFSADWLAGALLLAWVSVKFSLRLTSWGT